MDIIIVLVPMNQRYHTMKVNTKMKIGEAKELYYKKYGIKDEELIWRFEGRLLKDHYTFEDSGIEDQDEIILIKNNRGGGVPGFGIETIDLSKNISKVLKFDKNAPYYRYIINGLNIQSICSNNECEAYNKVVWVQIGYVNNYDLFQNIDKIKCPACDKIVVPQNFGFYKCKYKIKYMKSEKLSYSSGEVNGEAGNEFRTFDSSSGTATFVRLIFDVEKIYI